MTNKKTYYITTAIDYPNAEPHIGHAYQKIIADVLSRWQKLQGKDVFFLTGTDEHGKKIQEAAEKIGKEPKEFVDQMALKFKEAWAALNVQPNRFIRTTDADHQKIVQEAIKKCNKNGDIYKGHYEGLYCTNCESYYTEKDLIENCCPIHKKPIEKLKEESYFFKLSKYEKFLLNLYEKQPDFILPEERRNEITNRVKEGLKDLSISRTSFTWGIPFPLDKKHIIYVWFDALFNYFSGAGKNQKYWPADVHILGKDNGWFHTVYWPAFLKSAGYKLPKTVFIHGFLTVNGEKISKSLGNVISPKYLAEKYGTDSVRYFVTRNFVFGEDGDFSEKVLVERNNSELADKLGNLVSRVSTLAETYGLQKTKPIDSNKLVKTVTKHIDLFEFDKALNEIFSFIDSLNELVQSKKPWETKDKKVLYQLANGIKDVSILLSPFIPETCESIAKTFNFDLSLKALKNPLKVSKITKSQILFRKIEERLENFTRQSSQPNHPKEISVSRALKDKGINAHGAVFTNSKVSNRNTRIEELKRQFVKEVESIKVDNKILEGYKEFYKDKSLICGAESLINIIKKNKMFPNINTIVDAYNLISAQSFLSMGAHDLSKIKGNLSIKETDGKERFTPLGKKEPVKVNAEEYACMDEEKIICLMDVKQCDETKITKDTHGFLIYAQGNKNIDEEYVKKYLIEACELIKRTSGGEYHIIDEANNQKTNKPQQIEGIMTLSQIKYDDFAKLDLRVATIRKAEDIKGADKLLKLEVDIGTEKRTILAGIKKYYPKDSLIGKQIIVIVNLEPRKMKGLESQGMLLAASDRDADTVILISPEKKTKEGTKIS